MASPSVPSDERLDAASRRRLGVMAEIVYGPARLYFAPIDAPIDVTKLDPRTPEGQEWWTQVAGPRAETIDEAEPPDVTWGSPDA